MPNRTQHRNFDIAVSLDAAVYTADQNGIGVDIKGYDAVTAVWGFGATGDTLSGSVFVVGVLQESDDNSTFTDVAAADMVGTPPTVDSNAEDSVTYQVGYIGSKRYLRTKYDFTGTHSTGIEGFGLVIRHLPAQLPL
jgi:hypothetical protein